MTKAIESLVPGSTPAFLTVTVTETLPGTAGHDGQPHKHTWTGRPDEVAERQFTALYGRPRTETEVSPLDPAETDWMPSARWYPLRPGDLVHIHYEAGLAGVPAAFGETYIVGDAGTPGDPVPRLLSMVLLAHTLPDSTPEDDVKNLTGCYEAEAADDPLYAPWFEAKPHRLTIVRDGRVVHDGGAK
ncbi:hypothetical protein SCAB_64691 [Streptomyces scabiei 87.22]|uniref:Uncharacterized protein n=2 Tax=Streptomyces TaxID=1883 RepID=C9ZE40_STRSW|nr:hypothetical protein SCAB_64691 [Streptomyces scabiei 87.22]